MPTDGQTTLKSDLLAAYAAAGAKVLAWAAVSRLVLGGGAFAAEFALLALIRSTLGLLNYTSLGLAPTMIHFLSLASGSGQDSGRQQARRLYSNGLLIAGGLGCVGMLVVAVYASLFGYIHRVPTALLHTASLAALLVGLGMVFRLISDASSAWLQTSGRFRADNLLLVAAEITWIAATFALMRVIDNPLTAAGIGFAVAGAALMIARRWLAGCDSGLPRADTRQFDKSLALAMLSFGVMVTISQLADFLYAPTDFLLINWFLTPVDLAAYSVAVQIDAALLLVSAGASAAFLPRAALMLARKEHAGVMRLYLRGTLATGGLLVVAALAVWWLSSILLHLWLGIDPNHFSALSSAARPGTSTVTLPLASAILPWVLVHTVIGGSSGIGRSILLAAGKVWAFSVATVLAGLLNVTLSFVLVRYTDLGLRGIVIGTITAVALRCLVWMPWYIRRVLRNEAPSA